MTLYIWCAPAMALTALLATGAGARAATLRPFRELPNAVVRLSDLFDRLGETPDRDLGPSPAPGDRIVVEAPQLAAIARDFGVSWRPRSGAERAVLERGGVALSQQTVLAELRRALLASGADAGSEIDLPGFAPPMLPAGSTPRTEISQVIYDALSGKFEAVLSVTADDMAPLRERLAGQVIAMVDAAVLTRHLRPGTVLAADDIRVAHIHAALLRGNAAPAPASLIGMSLRHDIPAGQPLTAADMTRPILVARNGTVRMNLDASGIALSAQGLALEEGGLGDHVRVQNPTSRAVMLAEVTGDGEVRVMPGRVAVAQ
jgi:flagella basal body P-ring formation protein FlgA